MLSGLEDPEVVEQAWQNARTFSREFRLSGWILDPRAKEALAAVAEELLHLDAQRLDGGARSLGREAQVLCELYHRLRRVIDGELSREERAFRSFRLLPRFARRL